MTKDSSSNNASRSGSGSGSTGGSGSQGYTYNSSGTNSQVCLPSSGAPIRVSILTSCSPGQPLLLS